MEEIIGCWCCPDYTIPLFIISSPIFAMTLILWELSKIRKMLERGDESEREREKAEDRAV